MIDYKAIQELMPQERISVEDLSDNIYSYYSGSKPEPPQKAYSNTVGGYYKDRGWFYDKRLDHYFKLIGKYLLKKGSEAVVVGHEEFSIDPQQENIGQKNFVNILIPRKTETTHWIWLNGKYYNGFSYRARLYFSLEGDEESIKFIHALAKVLNYKDIPFRLKYEREFTNRNENCVLYFDKSSYFLIFIIVKNYYGAFYKVFRKPKSFPFVKTFGEFPGVAFAEDPDTGQSFGQQRSQVLAEILIDKGGDRGVIDQELRNRGFNPEKFYLNPSTDFPYNFVVFNERTTHQDYVLNFPKEKKYTYLPIIQKIVYLILRNFIVYTDGKGSFFHIPECKNRPGNTWDTVMNKTVYKLCSDSEKEEILHFLITYLEVLRQNELQDPYVHEFVKYYLLSLKPQIPDLISRLSNLTVAYGGGLVNSPGDIKFLGVGDPETKEYQENLENLIRNFQHRGVVSYLSNDEFIVSYSEYGYAYIGTHLLRQVISIE